MSNQPMTPDEEEEYKRDCLARALLREPKALQIRWASRQKPAFKEDIKRRMLLELEKRRGTR